MSEPMFMSVAKMKAEKIKAPLRLWIAGERATGKTVQLAYAANAGYKVYLLDLNGENYHACMEMLTEEGAANFIPVSIYNNFDPKGKKAKGKESQIAQIREVLEKIGETGDLDSPNTIVAIDSISDVGKSLLNVNEAYTGSGAVDKRVSVLDSYNAFITEYDYWMTATRKCKFIVIGHLMNVEGNYQFDFISKGYGSTVMNMAGISNLFVCDRKFGKDNIKYFVNTQPSLKHPFIKNSVGEKLEKEEQAEDFLAKFLKFYDET